MTEHVSWCHFSCSFAFALWCTIRDRVGIAFQCTFSHLAPYRHPRVMHCFQWCLHGQILHFSLFFKDLLLIVRPHAFCLNVAPKHSETFLNDVGYVSVKCFGFPNMYLYCCILSRDGQCFLSFKDNFSVCFLKKTCRGRNIFVHMCHSCLF